MGFWSDWGAAASVDWCEPNYVHSLYIAEFWNTLTCLVLVGLGLEGMRRWAALEPRIRAAYTALFLVGMGSVAFHGTLLAVSQAADELPMVYGSLIILYCFVHADRPGSDPKATLWRRALTTYALLFTGGYYVWQSAFAFFIFSYAALVAGSVLVVAKRLRGPKGDRAQRVLGAKALVVFLLALCGFWFPEHVFLTCDHWYQSLELHAVWHCGAGLATWWWIRLAEMAQQSRLAVA